MDYNTGFDEVDRLLDEYMSTDFDNSDRNEMNYGADSNNVGGSFGALTVNDNGTVISSAVVVDTPVITGNQMLDNGIAWIKANMGLIVAGGVVALLVYTYMSDKKKKKRKSR
jgi:hypothetical protein